MLPLSHCQARAAVIDLHRSFVVDCDLILYFGLFLIPRISSERLRALPSDSWFTRWLLTATTMSHTRQNSKGESQSSSLHWVGSSCCFVCTRGRLSSRASDGMIRPWYWQSYVSNSSSYTTETLTHRQLVFTLYCVALLVIEANGGGTHITSVPLLQKLLKVSNISLLCCIYD